jgi:MFS family permease
VSASYTLSLAPRLLQPFLGALIDRVNPRNWLIASPGVQALLVLGLVATFSIGAVHLWLIYVAAFAVNLFAAGDAVAAEALPRRPSAHTSSFITTPFIITPVPLLGTWARSLGVPQSDFLGYAGHFFSMASLLPSCRLPPAPA